jgi:hypothetical protein
VPTTTSFRYFVVPTLPSLFWLFEKRLSVTVWDLGAGWALRLERSTTGSGPGSTVRIVAPDGSAGQRDLEWNSPSWAVDGPQDTLLDRLLDSGTGRTTEKTRRGVMVDTIWWEVVEHHGPRAGLLTARRGLEGLVPTRQIPLPEWVGEELTVDQFLGRDLALSPLAG